MKIVTKDIGLERLTLLRIPGIDNELDSVLQSKTMVNNFDSKIFLRMSNVFRRKIDINFQL